MGGGGQLRAANRRRCVERLGRVDYRPHGGHPGRGAGRPVRHRDARRSAHPRKLVVVGGPASRLEVARAWGADATIDVADHPTPEARREAVLSAGRRARGRCRVRDVRRAAARWGRGCTWPPRRRAYLVAGTVGGGAQQVDAHLIVRRNLTIIGSLGAEIDAYYKAMEFLRHERDRFDWDLLIGGRYSPRGRHLGRGPRDAGPTPRRRPCSCHDRLRVSPVGQVEGDDRLAEQRDVALDQAVLVERHAGHEGAARRARHR